MSSDPLEQWLIAEAVMVRFAELERKEAKLAEQRAASKQKLDEMLGRNKK